MATLQSLVGKYFGDLGPETVNLMTQIAMAESSGNVAAYNPQDPYGGSYGLFQINGVHGYDPQRLMSDPEYNLMAARQVYDKQGPQAWSTYGQVAGGGGGYMPTQESDDGGDLGWWEELWDSDDGTGSGINEWDESTWSPEQRVDFLGVRGFKHLSGNGPTAAWLGPDGKIYTEDDAFAAILGEDAKPLTVAGGGSAGGFSLSPGQTRYDATGRPIASAPRPYDPTAELDLQIKQTNLRFLQDKFAFEMSQGLRKEANSTRQQIFSNQMDLTRLQMEMQQQKQRLAMDIGTLASDPGDRGKFAATLTALGGQWGKSVTSDQRTDDSLMPLESLLRQQEGLGGVTTPTAPQFAMPPSGVDLTALLGGSQGGILRNDNPNMPADWQWQAPPPYVPEGTTEIPDTAPNVMPPESGVDLQSLIAGADGDIPTRGHGGIEDEAFIAGEAGPEIVIPMGKGKTAVLNEGQAEALGINLKKLTKMALGGIFDGLVADQDRSKSRGFLDESVARSLKGTPWQSADDIADPVVAAGPSVDPLVAQIMASINAMAKGVPVSYYQRQAALMRPQGVAEGPVRRSA